VYKPRKAAVHNNLDKFDQDLLKDIYVKHKTLLYTLGYNNLFPEDQNQEELRQWHEENGKEEPRDLNEPLDLDTFISDFNTESMQMLRDTKQN